MEKTKSVIIPNYNGGSLLRANLQSVIEAFPESEIIIVDDASKDDSIDFIKKSFKHVQVITLAKNHGFSHAVNTGVKKASGDLLVFLNTDVKVHKNFYQETLPYFEKADTFAVAFAENSHEKGRTIIRGRGSATFKKGFLTHFAITPDKGYTFWVSGGSCIIDKQKFLELGGFDETFSPFYWEDIDLSFRAWRSGYKCYFEPNAKVDHYHQNGSIRVNYSKSKIKAIAYRNQFLFVWKNIDDELMLVNHIIYLPINIFRAVISLDLAFIIGFFTAILAIPTLITHNHGQNYTKTDSDVLREFKKYR